MNKIKKNSKLNLDSLNISTLKALNFFTKNPPKKIDLNFNFPIIVASGNAYNTGLALFSKQKAIFANESNFKLVLKNYKDLIAQKIIDQALIISASGEKDSIWITRAAKKAGLKTTLLTHSEGSSASKLADQSFFFKKLSEPYTYNISTYLGLFLAYENEAATQILSDILNLKIRKDFRDYKAYAFILPDEYLAIANMIEVKGREIFGPKLILRAFTSGDARHAKFLIRDKNELVISFMENKHFGFYNKRWNLNLRKKISNAYLMSLSYFLIGLLQEAKPSYFKDNLASYCQDYGYQSYDKGKPFPILVPGNED